MPGEAEGTEGKGGGTAASGTGAQGTGTSAPQAQGQKGAGGVSQEDLIRRSEVDSQFAAMRTAHKQELVALREELTGKLGELETLKTANTELRSIIDERLPEPPEPEETDALSRIEAALNNVPKSIKTAEGREIYRRFLKNELLRDDSIAEMRAKLNEVTDQNKRLLEESQQRQREKEIAELERARATRTSRINGMIARFTSNLAEGADEGVYSWLDDRVVEDKAGRLYFKPKTDATEDELLPFSEEVIEGRLPKYFRKSAISGEGSGSGGGKQAPTTGQVEALKQKKAEIIAAGEKAPAGDKDRYMREVQRLNREIFSAERALGQRA